MGFIGRIGGLEIALIVSRLEYFASIIMNDIKLLTPLWWRSSRLFTVLRTRMP
jgi:hypothetical protein